MVGTGGKGRAEMRAQRRGIDSVLSRRLLHLARRFADHLRQVLGENLVSVVLFGSVARGEATATSDIDALVVMETLPRGRFRRLALLDPAEAGVTDELEGLEREGVLTRLACLVKTRKETERVVPLYLDMVEDAVILYDKGDFFRLILATLRQKLQSLGARRLQMGRVRYWDLKPDFTPGQRFEI
jgi:predicted nucleotidyltransferase